MEYFVVFYNVFYFSGRIEEEVLKKVVERFNVVFEKIILK